MENLFEKRAIFVEHGSSDAYDVILRTHTTESQGSRTYFSAIWV